MKNDTVFSGKRQKD